MMITMAIYSVVVYSGAHDEANPRLTENIGSVDVLERRICRTANPGLGRLLLVPAVLAGAIDLEAMSRRREGESPSNPSLNCFDLGGEELDRIAAPRTDHVVVVSAVQVALVT